MAKTRRSAPASRARRRSSSALMPVVAVAVSMVATITAVGIGVSLLKADTAVSAVPGNAVVSSAPAAVAPAHTPLVTRPLVADGVPDLGDLLAKTTATTPGADAASSTTGDASASAAASSGSSSQAAPAATSGFDPSIMGASGFSNIPSYQQVNADVKGWLNVPDTNINYPVLYDSRILSGSSPHYYLDRDIYKNPSKDGVIYADPAVRFGTSAEISKNTVLYGHNWLNYSANPRIGDPKDVMFGQLAAFHHLSFAQKHPYIYYSTGSQEMRWVIFAAFYTDINFTYIEANPDQTNFINIVSGAKARSRFNYDVTVTTADKILTLSTCTRAYGKSDRQRFVVMARLMRADETFVPINIVTNPNPVLPKL